MANDVVLVETSDVDKETLWLTICALTSLGDQQEKSKPIYLAFNSGGGDGLYGLGLYHFIKGLEREIISVNLDQCSSAVLMPYLACEKRLSLPDAKFGIHCPYKKVDGKIVKLDDAFHKLQQQLLPKHPAIVEALSEADPIRFFSADDLYQNNMIVSQIISNDHLFSEGTIVASVKDNQLRMGGCQAAGLISY